IYIDRIEIDFGIDENSIVPAAQAGIYNFITMRDSASVDSAERAGLNLVEDISQNWYVGVLSINNNIEPFNDPKGIEASRHAVNSEENVESALLGEGEAIRSALPHAHRFYNE